MMPDDFPPEFLHAVFKPCRFRSWRYDRGRPIRQPPDPDRPDYKDPYWKARYEHAWLLRCERLTYREIGERLGLSGERAKQLIHKFSRVFNRRNRRMRVRFIREDAA